MATIGDAFNQLREAYGPQGWWPSALRDDVADGWEIIVGAVLVQHTSWKNVVRAIGDLDRAAAMSPLAIDSLSEDNLDALVRAAGPPRVKAKRLKAFARFLFEEYGGSVEALLAGVEERRVAIARREQLLKVHGVGPETADAILLYAGGAPVFVVDAYKRRVMARHGWGDAAASYDEVARWWRRRLPPDPAVYNEAHALLVRVGVEHCRRPTPRCEGCPLEKMLPRGGPRAD